MDTADHNNHNITLVQIREGVKARGPTHTKNKQQKEKKKLKLANIAE